jgi:hypothetical protein
MPLPSKGPAVVSSTRLTAPEGRTTDVDGIKKIAAATCSLPALSKNAACVADLGPSYELRFTDTANRTTLLSAAAFGCGTVDGLSAQRRATGSLWEAMASAGLPAPAPGR